MIGIDRIDQIVELLEVRIYGIQVKDVINGFVGINRYTVCGYVI